MMEQDAPDDMALEAAPQPEVSPAELLQSIIAVPNIAAEMADRQLVEIGQEAKRSYDLDRESMSEWLAKMEKAIDLATLVKKEKSYPFEKASNIKYPLVTSAALQFNARAYPAIVPSDDVVKARVWGRDVGGKKAARGERVSSFMSWQLACEIEEWESDTDKLLVQLPIVGDMFRKVWFDGERPRCKLIEPGKMVINAKCQNIWTAPRCTEEYDLYPYQIKEREADGRFIAIEYNDKDEDDQAPEAFIEQHTRLDLDEDGYPEPYIVTVHCDTEKVVAIAADFTLDDVKFRMEPRPVAAVVQTEMGPMQVMQMQEFPAAVERIKSRSYFVHYQFMPGMDGGFWGTGLGVLLGDISSAINTSFNQLFDAGHYASLGGGFIGAEFRLKGGAKRMRPGEWAMVNAKGADVRSAIVPMTFPGPDATMFQMLGLLIDAGKEISSTADVLTGETARTQTATTTMALIEQGLKVFTAAYKRIFRSMKREYKLFAEINAATLDPAKYNAFLDDVQQGEDGQLMPVQHDPRQDFGAADMDIQPVSDPNSVTKMQEMAKAQLVMEMAEKGMADPAEAAKRIFEAASVHDADALIPKPDPMMEQIQQIMTQLQVKDAEAAVQTKLTGIEKMLSEIMENRAQAAKLEAETQRAGAETAKTLVEADAADPNHPANVARLQIDAAKAMQAGRRGPGTA